MESTSRFLPEGANDYAYTLSCSVLPSLVAAFQRQRQHQSGGSERGPNLVFCLEADGISVVHMGDLGHLLSEEQAGAVGRPDVLLIPVGGTFTVDANEATEIVNQLNPRLVVPMHFKTSKCNLPIAGVDEFLQGKSNVKRAGGSVLEVSRENMPETTEIVVLDHAL